MMRRRECGEFRGAGAGHLNNYSRLRNQEKLTVSVESMKLKGSIAAMEAYVPGRSVPGAVKLSSNENPLGPSPAAVKAMREMLEGVHRYPDGASTALRRALAERWNRAPENLLIANGSDEVFRLLAAAWLSPGENAVAARQTFSQYRQAVRLVGGEMREINLAEGRSDLDAMADAVDEGTRMIFICSPNNPTGTYRSHGDTAAFLDRVPGGVIVVLDEAYADFAEAPDFPDSRGLLEDYPNLVVSRSFSKLHGLAGLRVGFAVGHERIINGAERASMPFNVNAPAQAGALAALDDDEHRRVSVELVHSEKRFLQEEFERRGIVYYPTEANFICFECFGRDTKARELWGAIAEGGIVVRDLASFGLPRMIRFTFGTRENNRRFLDILDGLIETG